MFQMKISEVILKTPELLARRDAFGVYYLTVDPTSPKVFDLLFGKDLCVEVAEPFLKQPYGPGRMKPVFTTELSPRDDNGKPGQGAVLSLQDYTRGEVTMMVNLCLDHMYRKNWRRERERIERLRRAFVTDGIAAYLFVFFSKYGQDLDNVDRTGKIFLEEQFGIPASDVKITVSYFSTRLTAAVEPEMIMTLYEKLGSPADGSLDRLQKALREPFDVCFRKRKIHKNYHGALVKLFDSFHRGFVDPSQRDACLAEQLDLIRAALDPDALYLYLLEKARAMERNESNSPDGANG